MAKLCKKDYEYLLRKFPDKLPNVKKLWEEYADICMNGPDRCGLYSLMYSNYISFQYLIGGKNLIKFLFKLFDKFYAMELETFGENISDEDVRDFASFLALREDILASYVKDYNSEKLNKLNVLIINLLNRFDYNPPIELEILSRRVVEEITNRDLLNLDKYDEATKKEILDRYFGTRGTIQMVRKYPHLALSYYKDTPEPSVNMSEIFSTLVKNGTMEQVEDYIQWAKEVASKNYVDLLRLKTSGSSMGMSVLRDIWEINKKEWDEYSRNGISILQTKKEFQCWSSNCLKTVLEDSLPSLRYTPHYSVVVHGKKSHWKESSCAQSMVSIQEYIDILETMMSNIRAEEEEDLALKAEIYEEIHRACKETSVNEASLTDIDKLEDSEKTAFYNICVRKLSFGYISNEDIFYMTKHAMEKSAPEAFISVLKDYLSVNSGCFSVAFKNDADYFCWFAKEHGIVFEKNRDIMNISALFQEAYPDDYKMFSKIFEDCNIYGSEMSDFSKQLVREKAIIGAILNRR